MKRQTTIFSSQNSEPSTSSFKTFSQFIQSTSELISLMDEHNDENKSETTNFALIGLHSCGNLSNSIVNLYLTNSDNNVTCKKRAKLLCNVSCCYNLLNEKYANDVESNKDIKKTNVSICESSKFPMSKYLNELKYSLNFNIRMLACHSLDRCFQSIDDFKEVYIYF
jgi:hypothetical protein